MLNFKTQILLLNNTNQEREYFKLMKVTTALDPVDYL
jgi:hypothetical protein